MIYEKITDRTYYQVIRTFDPRVGWTLKPDRVFELIGDEWHSRVETNELGFRGPIPGGGEKNLLVLGDSNTVSIRVDYGDTFLAELDGRLAEYAVSNMAVGGWASVNQYLALQRFADRYDPDVVLFQLYLQNGLVENQKLAILDDRVCIDSASLQTALPDHGSESPLRRSARRGVSAHPVLRRASQVVGLVDRPHPLTTYKREYDEGLQRGLEKTVKLISKAAKYCRQRGIEFGVVSVPSPWQVDDDWLAAALDRHDLAESELDLRKPDRAVAEHCKNEGIQFHDLYDRLRGASGDIYFETVDHWTPAGHDVVADELTPVIDEWT